MSFKWFIMLLAVMAGMALGQTGYKLPPKAVVDIVDAPSPPSPVASPDGKSLLLVDYQAWPGIAVIARPFAGLAGVRIDPVRSCLRRVTLDTGISLEDVMTQKTVRINLPAGAEIHSPLWSPDSERFAFTQDTEKGTVLWIGDRANDTARQIPNLYVNDMLGIPARWIDNHTLLVRMLPASRGAMPAPPVVPEGPVVEQNEHRKTKAYTYEDLLTCSYDEDLFDYFGTSQVAKLDVNTDAVSLSGSPGMYSAVLPSPDGKYLVVTRLKRPYSYRLRYDAFSRTTQVIDFTTGQSVCTLADQKMADAVTTDDVAPPGGRGFEWDPAEPASLYWAEATRAGDRLISLKAPFTAAPRLVFTFVRRLEFINFSPHGHEALISEYDRNRRWRRTYYMDLADARNRRIIFDRSSNDVYNDPGRPMYTVSSSGQAELLQHGDEIYLSGEGSSVDGDHPFVDRLNLQTFESTRIFQAPTDGYEQMYGFAGSPEGQLVITSYQNQSTPPNYFLKRLGQPGSPVLSTTRPTTRPATDPPATLTTLAQLTNNTDPNPQITGATKQLLKYKRADGVELSATLYLPPGYDPASGKRLPVIMSAYPREFTDSSAAGEVHAAPNKFTWLWGPSPLMFLTHGYAVMMDTSMPVVGPPRIQNDTFIEQITADAQAAVDTVVKTGVGDRRKIVVFGHSYGAFMVANLLEHTHLFAAGIARSGAYNRTLTPFGFQDEERTYWDAPDLYFKMSPFNFANHINAPILLIHGQMDNNMGTFPIQSQRFYEALAGNGATARLVLLPHEAHAYQARESVLDVVEEMFEWADKYTSDSPATQPATGNTPVGIAP